MSHLIQLIVLESHQVVYSTFQASAVTNRDNTITLGFLKYDVGNRLI